VVDLLALEWRPSVFTSYLQGVMEASQVELGLNAVFYGDQNKIPAAYTLCIEPDDMSNEYAGVPRKMDVEVNILFILYVDRLQSVQLNRFEADQKIEAIQNKLHEDPQVNEMAIDSYVRRMESGYVQKEESIIRASRLLFQIRTRQFLPLAPA
jgi:hypothetical protein